MTAQTERERNASVRVLEKSGFERVGESADPHGQTWLFELRRA